MCLANISRGLPIRDIYNGTVFIWLIIVKQWFTSSYYYIINMPPPLATSLGVENCVLSMILHTLIIVAGMLFLILFDPTLP